MKSSSMLLRFSVLLLSFVHLVIGETCHPCGDSQYEMTTLDYKFHAGVEQISCRDLISVAGDRRKGTDVCYLVNNYAMEHCGCMDDNNNPAPELPYRDSTAACNICGGDQGSDLWSPSPSLSERNVPTSLGISVKCGFLFTTGLQGAFLPEQCPGVQDATREACGCALRDVNGNVQSGASSCWNVWFGLVFLNAIALYVLW